MENKNYDFNLDEDLKKDLFGDPVSSQIPKESLMDDFLSEMSSQGASAKDLLEDIAPVKEDNEFSNFERPLPPEPAASTLDFLQGETNDYFGVKNAERDSPSPVRDFDTPSPVPPQVPLHAYEKAESPVLKKRDPSPPSRDDSPLFKGKESPLPPPTPERDSPEFRDDSPEPLPRTPEPELPKFKPVEEFKEPEEIKEPKKPEPEKPKTTFIRKKSVEDIGAQDIRVKIDAWFNPARLHPAVESLVYWRDPKKSGVVFGVIMLTLISLTMYSLISVVAYLCLITVLGTVSFRIYKSIMQAVQKTSDGHPFKEILDIDLSIPEDKVKEVSLLLVQYINSSVASLRSLFLVEDIIDSIKFAVILWVLTYVGAYFNGLTLIIIGVILLFSLPKVYENNKAQIDVYIKLGMDKLSVITNKVKTIVPESKKEEKAKDQ